MDEKSGTDSDEEDQTLSMLCGSSTSSALHSSIGPHSSSIGDPSSLRNVESSDANHSTASAITSYLKRSSEAIMGKPASDSDDGEDDDDSDDEGRDEREKNKREGGKKHGDSDASSGSKSRALVRDTPLSANMSQRPLQRKGLASDDGVRSRGRAIHYPPDGHSDIVESDGEDSVRTDSSDDDLDIGKSHVRLSILDDDEFIFSRAGSTDGRNRSALDHSRNPVTASKLEGGKGVKESQKCREDREIVSGETVSPGDVKALRDALAKAEQWNCSSCAVLWTLFFLGSCVIVVFIFLVLQNARIESLERRIGGGDVGIGFDEFRRSGRDRLLEAIEGSSQSDGKNPGQREYGGEDSGGKAGQGGPGGSGNAEGGTRGGHSGQFLAGSDSTPLDSSIGKPHLRSRRNAQSGAKPGADTTNVGGADTTNAASGRPVAGTNAESGRPFAKAGVTAGAKQGIKAGGTNAGGSTQATVKADVKPQVQGRAGSNTKDGTIANGKKKGSTNGAESGESDYDEEERKNDNMSANKIDEKVDQQGTKIIEHEKAIKDQERLVRTLITRLQTLESRDNNSSHPSGNHEGSGGFFGEGDYDGLGGNGGDSARSDAVSGVGKIRSGGSGSVIVASGFVGSLGGAISSAVITKYYGRETSEAEPSDQSGQDLPGPSNQIPERRARSLEKKIRKIAGDIKKLLEGLGQEGLHFEAILEDVRQRLLGNGARISVRSPLENYKRDAAGV